MTYTVKQLTIGLNEVSPSLLMINTTDTVATVLTAGYLGPAFNYSDVTFTNTQLAIVYTTDGGTATYSVSVDENGIASLVLDLAGIVSLPVIDGNLPKFSGITGVMVDSGISPSNAAKTKMVMANGAVTVGRMACFTDTVGTVDDNPATAVNGGNIQAGLSGTAGTLASFPSAATSGQFTIQATANSGAFNTVLTNNALGQTTTYTLPDPGAASAGILVSTLTAPDNNANTIRFDTTVGTTALNSGAVTLFTSSGSKQYKVVALWLNFGANLAAGNKNLAISDGTTTYSVIPSASLLTLVNATWGSTAVPFPTAAALDTSTAAGASITVTYSGGTTNYTGGANIVISGVLQRVA